MSRKRRHESLTRPPSSPSTRKMLVDEGHPAGQLSRLEDMFNRDELCDLELVPQCGGASIRAYVDVAGWRMCGVLCARLPLNHTPVLVASLWRHPSDTASSWLPHLPTSTPSSRDGRPKMCRLFASTSIAPHSRWPSRLHVRRRGGVVYGGWCTVWHTSHYQQPHTRSACFPVWRHPDTGTVMVDSARRDTALPFLAALQVLGMPGAHDMVSRWVMNHVEVSDVLR